LSFKHKGVVNVPCDLTSEDFDLPVRKMKLIVRFDEEFNNDNEELLVFHWEFEIDIAQYIHE
jgi:hypothetical protein